MACTDTSRQAFSGGRTQAVCLPGAHTHPAGVAGREDCLYSVTWVIDSVGESLAWPGDQSSAHGPEPASSRRELLHNTPCVISRKLLTQSWMWFTFLSLRLMCCIRGWPEKNSHSFPSFFSITCSFFGIQKHVAKIAECSELYRKQCPCRGVMWYGSVLQESDLILN